MNTSDQVSDKLNYSYPEELVALKPQEPCRVLFNSKPTKWGSHEPREIKKEEVLDLFAPGDLLVVNNSGVKACRVFYKENEILFLSEKENQVWEVLFRSAHLKVGDTVELPAGIEAELVKKGRPQQIRVSQKLTEDFFKDHGNMALPPYIQKLREQRQNVKEDQSWYQLDWKKNTRSLAAPTASLHFDRSFLESAQQKGAEVIEVSLDVGLGTFLPLTQKNFEEKKLHSESFFVSDQAKEKICQAKSQGRRVWALGTTALRAVESMDLECAETELFIQPGYEFKYISGLLTNFHQPNSSLLLLVMAFFGEEETLKSYKYAVDHKFRLFSYGDLSVWTRSLP